MANVMYPAHPYVSLLAKKPPQKRAVIQLTFRRRQATHQLECS